MADLPPTPPAPPVVQQSGQGSAASAAQNLVPLADAKIVSLPPKLQNVDRALMLGAQVSGVDPSNGQVTLKTAAGEIVVKTTTPLTGLEKGVALQLPAGNPPSNAVVMGSAAAATVANAATATPQNAGGVNVNQLMTSAALQTLGASNPTIKTAAQQQAILQQGTATLALVVDGSPTSPAPPSSPNTDAKATQSYQPTAQSNVSSPSTRPSSLDTNALLGHNSPALSGVAKPSSGQVGALSGRMLETVNSTLLLLGEEQQANVPSSRVPSARFSDSSLQNAQLLSPQRGTASLPPGNQLLVRVQSITPPGTPTPSPSGVPADAVLLEGNVVGTTSMNQPIVSTAQGTVILQGASNAPIGSKILLQWLMPGLAAGSSASGAMPVNLNGREWPAFEEIMQTLMAQDPAAARTLLNAMPKLDGNMPATLLFFLATLRGGDIKNWLGEKGLGDKTIDALRRAGRGNAADQVQKDFPDMAGVARDHSGEWKVYSVPLLTDRGIDRLHLSVRDQKEDDDDNKKEADRTTRFMVDIEFSELGPVQLDGLLQDKQLSMIVRMETPHFSPTERQESQQLFATVLDNMGMTGTLSYQFGNHNWVKLIAQRRALSKIQA